MIELSRTYALGGDVRRKLVAFLHSHENGYHVAATGNSDYSQIFKGGVTVGGIDKHSSTVEIFTQTKDGKKLDAILANLDLESPEQSKQGEAARAV